jgi:hypothetical protein
MVQEGKTTYGVVYQYNLSNVCKRTNNAKTIQKLATSEWELFLM